MSRNQTHDNFPISISLLVHVLLLARGAPTPTEKRSQAMEDLSALRDQVDALAAQVTKQGSAVRQLKKDGAASEDIAEAVTLLKKLKVDAEALKAKQDELDPSKKFNRKTFDELILRKMFVVPSFEIHGGVKGLFDLGPPACALKVCFGYGVCITRLAAFFHLRANADI